MMISGEAMLAVIVLLISIWIFWPQILNIFENRQPLRNVAVTPWEENNVNITKIPAFNIVIIGEGSTGKSTLLERFKKGKLDKNHEEKIQITTGKVDHTFQTIKKNMTTTWKIRDIGGQDEFFLKLANTELDDACAAFAVCSIDNPTSIRELEVKYLTALRNNNKKCKIYFICNKADLMESFPNNKCEIEKCFQRIKNNNEGVFGEIYYVSAFTGENVENALDSILEEILSGYISLNIIEKRSKEIFNQTLGKMATLWISDNKIAVAGYYENKKITKCKQEKYANNTLYYCSFDGNEVCTGRFNKVCQEIWQRLDHTDANDAVNKMADALYSKYWRPFVFAFDVNSKCQSIERCNKKWTINTDKITITVLC